MGGLAAPPWVAGPGHFFHLRLLTVAGRSLSTPRTTARDPLPRCQRNRMSVEFTVALEAGGLPRSPSSSSSSRWPVARLICTVNRPSAQHFPRGPASDGLIRPQPHSAGLERRSSGGGDKKSQTAQSGGGWGGSIFLIKGQMTSFFQCLERKELTECAF
ncbi:hypothetical protein H1C71_005899 [Ictidomys tridecemlineatus]|nr:hypothetical protein H1C71_005899 [Ictidomys tridecemlineatus]